MYEDAMTRVKSVCGETDEFSVRVGVHQCSALNPYLFLVMNEITNDIKGEMPWCMMLADDTVLKKRRTALEGMELVISRNKPRSNLVFEGSNREIGRGSGSST